MFPQPYVAHYLAEQYQAQMRAEAAARRQRRREPSAAAGPWPRGHPRHAIFARYHVHVPRGITNFNELN